MTLELTPDKQPAAEVQETLELLKEYENKLRLSDDPKERKRCEQEILQLRAQLDYYQEGRPGAGTQLQTPKKVFVSHLPDTGPSLFGRRAYLRILDQAWENPRKHLVSVIAEAGVGKTALVSYWLMRQGRLRFHGAARVFAWSFYREGVGEAEAPSDLFLENALRWFEDPHPNLGSRWERGARLADLIRTEPTILIIDGLEPLQHPPGRGGKLRDEALIALMRELAAYNNGLCIVSSRVGITEIAQFEPGTATRIDLQTLDRKSGARLLRAQRLKGPSGEFEKASDEFGGHCLALTLLASYLRDVHDGDICQRVRLALLEEDVARGGHATRVMASYERWFGEGPELAILRLVALFDRPVEERVLHFLSQAPVIPGLTVPLMGCSFDTWRRVVRNLSETRLLLVKFERESREIDAHPLTREYFGRQLVRSNTEAWKEANRRLFEYYAGEAELHPGTVQQMDPLFRAAMFGCRAERYEEVLATIYGPRIMRGEEAFAFNKLGALSALVSTLSYFFQDQDWSRPAEKLSRDSQLFVLTEAGRFLTALKGYAAFEVGQCYRRAKELCASRQKDHQLFEVMLGLCRHLRLRGELAESGKLAEDVLSLCQFLGDPSLVPAAQRALATNAYYTGQFREAEAYAALGEVDYASAQQALRSANLDVNEPGISCSGYRALCFWFLGRAHDAENLAVDTIRKAIALDHPHTLAITRLIKVMIHHFCRDLDAVQKEAQELMDLCAERDFVLWRVAGEIFHAYSACMKESVRREQSMSRLEENIAGWMEMDAMLFTPYWHALLAECSLQVGDTDRAVKAAARGLEISDLTGERWWDAELHRLKGEAVSGRPEGERLSEAEHREAIRIARLQGAVALELRAATGLALSLRDRDVDGARDVLQVLRSFAAGRETRDLVEGRQLLAALG
jgi:hypothetical protein